jgi:predicted NodU family carbamoyl transferase
MVTQDFDPSAILVAPRQGPKAAGGPMSTNVWFNLCGEVIVGTPVNAGRAFFRSGIDALKMGNFLVEK